MARHLGVAHIRQSRRLPARLVVLVDDHGAHTLIEIVTINDARDYAEFGAHARCEIASCAEADLRQRNFKTERRFGPHQGRGFARPFGVSAAGCRLTIERRQNGFNLVAGEQPVDRGAAGHHRPLAGRFGKGGQNRIHRHRAGQPIDQCAIARRRHAMRGETGGNAIGGVEAFAGQRAKSAEFAGHAG